jgi:heme/copper-type cytochrome/quinol oxidase subunit 2
MPTLLEAPYNTIMSANDWRLTLLVICFVIFVPLVVYIWKYTKNKDNDAESQKNEVG